MTNQGMNHFRFTMACLLLGAFCYAPRMVAVEDGLGTNIIERIRVEQLEVGGTVRTNWFAPMLSVGGGPVDFRSNSNQVFWSPVVPVDGTLVRARGLTDQGTADAQIVRANWNTVWGDYTAVNTLQADANGAEDSTWTSSWVSNGYRIGIVVTNFTSGTNLWWSVEYEQLR